MTSDTSAPVVAGVAVIGLVVAGAVGWVVAGSPTDPTLTPAPCPASFSSARTAAGGQRGVPDQVVPMQLPEPRGPVSVRLCGYDGHALRQDVVLDPTRTAALAGLIDAAPGDVLPGSVVVSVVGGARPAACDEASSCAVLVFRYRAGGPLFVQVTGGAGGDLVASPARAETGRADVVRRVTELLASSGRT